MLDSLFLPTAITDLDKLDENLHVLCHIGKFTPERVIAVVKDSGYGVGSLEMTQSLEKQGVNWFAVAQFDEALFLRDKNIESNILLLGITPESKIAQLTENRVTISIINTLQLNQFGSLAIKPDVHLLVDTGMNRNGLRYDDILSGKYDTELSHLSAQITGVYTHYHSSDQFDQEPTQIQQKRFRDVVEYLKTLTIKPAILHSGNSGAVLYGQIPEDEMVRFGISFHGITPDCNEDPLGLQEITEIKASVISVRNAKANEGVGYSHIYNIEKESTLATLSIGYGVGFQRFFTNKSDVIINGKRYPIKARVTMDFLIIDIGNDDVKVGDIATIIGSDGDEHISLCETAKNVETIPYEILCQLGSSLVHQYHRSGTIITTSKRSIY